MDTVKINRGNVRTVAHRGLSGIEPENTAAAFIAAANRSYYGIEADIHVTKDGKFIVCHDDNALRISGRDVEIEKATLAELQDIRLFGRDGGNGRADLRMPTLEEYISICKTYGKHAFLEFKNEFSYSEVADAVRAIDRLGYLDEVTFISFHYKNLLHLRSIEPGQPAQLLFSAPTEEIIRRLAEDRISADVKASAVTRELVKRLHAECLDVNCWTVDDPAQASHLCSLGVDFITTNILE